MCYFLSSLFRLFLLNLFLIERRWLQWWGCWMLSSLLLAAVMWLLRWVPAPFWLFLVVLCFVCFRWLRGSIRISGRGKCIFTQRWCGVVVTCRRSLYSLVMFSSPFARYLSSPSGPSHWALSAIPEEKTQLLFNGEVFDLFWFCTTWCPSSSMRAEYGQRIGRGIWPLLTCFIYCDAHLHLLSWAWTLLCDWDIWFPSCTFIAGDSALHGYLVISSKLFVLILLEIVWCRAELSALHRVSRCSNFVLAERDVLENKHEVWGSLSTRRTLYRTFVIIYFVLECKELWLFKFGWELDYLRTFGSRSSFSS